jgi:hypothetical protein
MMHDARTALCDHRRAAYRTTAVTAAECLTTLIIDYGILQIVLLKALYVLLTRRGPRLALTLGRGAALAIAAVSASRGNATVT